MQRERKLAKIMLRMKEMMSERAAATFGYSPGTLKPIPTNFLKKHSKERIIAYGTYVQEMENFPYNCWYSFLHSVFSLPICLKHSVEDKER
jgi:hypothetical protein